MLFIRVREGIGRSGGLDIFPHIKNACLLNLSSAVKVKLKNKS